MKLVAKVIKEHRAPQVWLVWMVYLDRTVFLEKTV